MTRWSFGRRGVCDGLKIHRTWFNSARLRNMVVVAQLARAPDCGSGGRGFEPLHSPKREYSSVAERMAVNHRVVGSSPSIPANRKYGRAVYGGTPLRCWTPQGSRKFESFCFREDKLSGCSPVGPRCGIWDAETARSNRAIPTRNGRLAEVV